ncbi:hypothetical protein NDR87_29765 [Nocardia sp. CDC159]|uniref:Uncharacterized protein n=1 Tax=Nocardia pulmonis TaxID=2951408 RepID=A0A9X2EG34_9NOCA|nr:MULTISPECIES: hypothetical protein [Nocardia]MCM6777631.1 hypothetical protein [Nocardia pulmonis]MCM6790565.1 hypothetical protein [Nocardia sp. CDC159]
MRVRTIALTTMLTGVAAAALIGAGTAGAAAPVAYPQAGAVGLELSTAETQAFANGPVPALIDHYLPGDNVAVGIRPDSQLPRIGTGVMASMRDIAGEAAGHPDGHVSIVIAPGPRVVVVQQW